jgi:hypothetical protein
MSSTCLSELTEAPFLFLSFVIKFGRHSITTESWLEMFHKVKAYYPILILFSLLYLFHFLVGMFPGDDIKFSKASEMYSLAEWLKLRYLTWSGRLMPDAAVYVFLDDLIWLWRILNPLMIILLGYSMIRILKKEVSQWEVIFAVVLLGYFADNILSSGVFWITGSMNYLWPIALGMASMIPFADKVFRKLSMKRGHVFIYGISGFMAAIGNEQAALCISSFAVLSLIAVYLKEKKVELPYLLLTGLYITGTCILLFAPGNEIRWVKESAYWYPSFPSLTIKDHLYIGTIWAYEQLFRDMRFLLLLLSGITIAHSYRNSRLREGIALKLFILFFGIVLSFHIMGRGLEVIYNFSAIKNLRVTESVLSFWEINSSVAFAFLPYLFWTIYLMLLSYLLIRESKNPFFMLFSLLAIGGTLFVIFFSPTIYGSGNRVLTVASVLFTLISIYKIDSLGLLRSKKLIMLIAIFPFANLSLIFFKWFTSGFHPFL